MDTNNLIEQARDGDVLAIDAVCNLIEQQQRELETERMRLAACSTAALGYFDGCCDEYKSASLDDVLRLRARLEAAKKLIARLAFVLDSFDPSEPIGCTYKWIGPDPDLVDKALAAAKQWKEIKE